jgi:hypothetical protein
MLNITVPFYDKCREWINSARNNEIPWVEINYARTGNEESLKNFLEHQHTFNFWPKVDTTTWLAIVEHERSYELKRLELQQKGKMAVLVDSTQDNELTIPTDERSSWMLYKSSLLETGWTMESVEEMERATIGILKRLNHDTIETGPIKGLVIGNVQSGKTANMAALMAMAADWGWNMFIVLSGTIENLRKQTQSRLLRDLNRPGNLTWQGLEHLSKRTSMGQRASDLRFEEDAMVRYFTVCLKNSARLKNLIEWMQHDQHKHQQMKVLVIDDEADQASINTADISSSERAKINSLIVNLVEGNKPNGDNAKSNVRAMNYISYTATPYANFLNESSRDSLYPRNFIRTLQTSNEYFGPKEIFGIEGTEECDGLDIIRDISDEDLVTLESLHQGETAWLPDSLKKSVYWFLIAASSMRINKYNKPVSMLVHTSQKQIHHKEVSDAILDWLKNVDKEELISRCEETWERETKRFSLASFRANYPNYGRTDDQIPDYPDFHKLIPYIKDLVQDITHIPLGEDGELDYHEGIHLCIDNCANNGINDEGMFVRLAYPEPNKLKKLKEKAPAFIIVGGSTLSRGLTIEGLVSTYFLRSSSQADTLMQMGRWFGYRKGYELLPRIWMTAATHEKFQFLAALDMELREDLQRYMYAGADPTEFGPRVKNTPKISWMRITAKNRMQGAKAVDLDFTGTNSQTIYFENNKGILSDNIKFTEEFVSSLGACRVSDLENSLVWDNIDFTIIQEKLLGRFNFHPRSRVFNQMDAFCQWIRKVSEEANLDDWNVVIAGLGKVNAENENSWKLPQGSVELVSRSKKKSTNGNDGLINIGVLRAPRDLYADIKLDRLSEELKLEILNNKTTTDFQRYREAGGLAKTPQLLIYRIDKDSKARSNSAGRENLNAIEDIIGICILIPGFKKGVNLARALTVEIDKDQIDNDSDLREE